LGIVAETKAVCISSYSWFTNCIGLSPESAGLFSKIRMEYLVAFGHSFVHSSVFFMFYVSLLQHGAAPGTWLMNSLLLHTADQIVHFCHLWYLKDHVHVKWEYCHYSCPVLVCLTLISYRYKRTADEQSVIKLQKWQLETLRI
jgi:hypothetical protein